MAVKVPNHAFFAHYRRETIALFVLTQILSALVAGGAALYAWDSLDSEPILAFTIGIVLLVVVNLLSGLILFAIASKPLQLLSQAIAHVSDDPVVTQPPQLNAKKYERSGLKAMVQTVYELAVASHPGGKVQSQPNTDLYKELADDLPCGLIALDNSGQIIYANTLAPLKDTADGRKIPTLIFEQQNAIQAWLADCEANKVRDTRVWQRIADRLPGEEGRRIFDVIGYYQKENPAGVTAIIVTFDRTPVYSADQEDMDFIALAAHELRGPITVIRGYLDVIENELSNSFTEDQQELFDRLKVSSERLAGYVTNILNVSRYDRQQFKIHRQEEDLTNIIKTLIPDLALRASTQHRTLHFDIPPGLPTIAADRTSLGEVLTNLIDNAIKYSREGGEVQIRAAKTDDDSIEITVHDTGIGMPESVVGGLFNKFYRSHRSKQSVGGTGLGLYICKAIVEAHGGTIWVRSREGQGSTFGFTIPTYASVANKLRSGDNQDSDIVQRQEGWIKNHAMYRR